MSHHASKPNLSTTRRHMMPSLAEVFSWRYPEYVLFVRFVPKHELHKYCLDEEGYGVFTSQGDNVALFSTLEDACDWVHTEECEPVLMH